MRKSLSILVIAACAFFVLANDLPAKPGPNRVMLGKKLYDANECSACHLISAQGCKGGVPLDKLPPSHDRKFVIEQLQDPEAHVKKNAKAFMGDSNLMPNPRLSREEAALIADYIVSLQKKSKPRRK